MIFAALSEKYVDGVCEIEKNVFSTPYSNKIVVDDMNNPMHRTIVALDDDGNVAAYCMMSFVLDEASLDRIAVKPSFRRCGVAKLLIDDMTDYCRSSGIAFINLEVRQTNSAARSLYEKCGFKQVGVRRKYYPDAEDAILYTLNLV